jgi:hypothetical protein
MDCHHGEPGARPQHCPGGPQAHYLLCWTDGSFADLCRSHRFDFELPALLQKAAADHRRRRSVALQVFDAHLGIRLVEHRIGQVGSKGHHILNGHACPGQQLLQVRPDQFGLFLKGLRHGLAVGLVAVEAADDQQACRPCDLDGMAVRPIGRKQGLGVVLDDCHERMLRPAEPARIT